LTRSICSMEIGSAYALQVCLLQIPAMVGFSAWYAPDKLGSVADTFTCVFCLPPRARWAKFPTASPSHDGM
jgi:Ca2+/H+ antiporter